MDLIAILDEVKARTGSDYRTAQILEIHGSAISHWRNGAKHSGPSVDNCYSIHEITEIPLAIIIASTEVHRAKTNEIKVCWELRLKKLCASVTTAVLVLLLAGSLESASAGTGLQAGQNSFTQYTLRLIRRIVRKGIKALQVKFSGSEIGC